MHYLGKLKAQKGLRVMEQELDTKGQKQLKTGKNTWGTQLIFVGIYLLAIVIANLLTAKYGIAISIFNSFWLIGLDLSTRDTLHELWGRKGLVWKMGLLILTGSILSWVFNKDAGDIAKASFLAFAAASAIDAFIYQLLKGKHYLVKSNGSNVFGALADSIVFPTIAFGGIMPLVTLMQFVAKVGGGFLWSLVLNILRSKKS